MSGSAERPNLSLSDSQQALLRAALASNPRGSPGTSGTMVPPQGNEVQGAMYMSNQADLYTSPTLDGPASGNLSGDFDESPIFENELEDGQLEWDESAENLFGDLPETDLPDGEHHDKRKASPENDTTEEGAKKKREGDEKTAKKPGRKPLTAEPTTKRKAQNRAAQRAFRERKERHLKDLETKVDELEKASEATNHENGRLRSQVEKLNMEVKEYRKRLSLNSTSAGVSPPLANPQAREFYNSNNFQFNFPKFGDLPSSFMSNGSMAKTSSNGDQTSANPVKPSAPSVSRQSSSGSPVAVSSNSNGALFGGYSVQSPTGGESDSSFISNNVTFDNNDFSDLSALFTPSVLEAARRSNSADYMSSGSVQSPRTSVRQGSNGTVNGQQQPAKGQRTHASSMASPVSSLSQNGLDSSSGTTPESYCDSPDHQKPSEPQLNTISEEASAPFKADNLLQFGGVDVNGIDWMAQQNGGQFDPVLFGDYRDPQDNVANANLGDFFNDAFPSTQDFNTPYNTGDVSSIPTQSPRPDLPTKVEAQADGDADQSSISHQKFWEHAQNSQKVMSGELDLDQLCSEFKAKAKCSKSRGEVIIGAKDAENILNPNH